MFRASVGGLLFLLGLDAGSVFAAAFAAALAALLAALFAFFLQRLLFAFASGGTCLQLLPLLRLQP